MKFLYFFSFITQQIHKPTMAEATASGDVCPSGEYGKKEHQNWCEYAKKQIQKGVYLDSLSWSVITFWTVEKRETVYPPRLWSTVVAYGREPYTCG